MAQITENPEYMSVEEVRKNPELITQLLFKKQDVSVLIEKRGNKIRYAYLKIHNKKAVKILEEAKKENETLKEKGYSREQAFKDFHEAKEKMNKYL